MAPYYDEDVSRSPQQAVPQPSRYYAYRADEPGGNKTPGSTPQENNNNVDWTKPHEYHANIAHAPLPTRNRFIAKVYTILFVQLCFTAVVGILFWIGARENEFIKNYGQLLYIVSSVGVLACLFTLMCCGQIVRAYPRNYIFLSVLTLFMSITVGFVSSFYNLSDIGAAFGITAGLFLVLSIIAVTVKKDFTGYGKYLFIAMIALILFALVIFGLGAFKQLDGKNRQVFRWLHIGISIAVVIMMSFYIVRGVLCSEHRCLSTIRNSSWEAIIENTASVPRITAWPHLVYTLTSSTCSRLFCFCWGAISRRL